VSLVSIFLALLAPALALGLRGVKHCHVPVQVNPAVPLVLVMVLFAIDCLMNGMLNPTYPVALGGVYGSLEIPATVERSVGGSYRPIRADKAAGTPIVSG